MNLNGLICGLPIWLDFLASLELSGRLTELIVSLVSISWSKINADTGVAFALSVNLLLLREIILKPIQNQLVSHELM